MKNWFALWMSLLSLGILIGLYAIFKIFTVGHGEMANTSALLPWGLQVSTYIYLALTSTGCSFVYCLATLGGVENLKPIVPRAIVLALLTILAGFTSLGLEIGRLERLAIEFALVPNFTSPMWWMGVFYSLYIIVLAVELIAMIFNIEWLMKVGSVAVLITAVSGHSTLGAVFGVLETRSYGFGALTPIYFLIMAFLGGTSLILFASSVISMLNKGNEDALQGSLAALRKIFMIAIGIVFISSLWRYIVGVWVSNPYYDLFEIGSKKFMFFSVILGMIVPLLIAVFRKKDAYLALAAFIVLFVQFFDRNTLIVGIQKVALWQGVWEPGILPYTPAPIEISVVIFVMSGIALIFSLVEKMRLLEKIKH